jgi:glycerol-1-phosphate dehydrogenase [NAD(P)+]
MENQFMATFTNVFGEDVAKYVAFLCQLPYLSVPTSLSNDGFCSSQSSLTFSDRRRSLPSAMPFGVILDTAVCLNAPDLLWHSGIGDLVSKLTAVTDWKMAFHAIGTPVDDFAALLSDASVFQFMGRPPAGPRGNDIARHSIFIKRYFHVDLRLLPASQRKRASGLACSG